MSGSTDNLLGTEVIFRPGIVHGGEVEFECGTERGIVYFLEMILLVAPFCKLALRLTLHGVSSEELDQTIDSVKNINVPILRHFGVSEGVDFKILRRGAKPLGGGQVFFTCPVVGTLQPVTLTDVGRIKKIRGIAAATRVSPQVSNRMIEAARSQLNEFIPDVYIYSDVFKGQESGRSPGYSLFLQAESTTGALLSADAVGVAGEPVEEMAVRTARKLLGQVRRSGVVDQSHQWMLLTLMALCPEDLSKVVLGPLAEGIAALLEDIRLFFGVLFKIRREQPAKGLTTVSCIGAGFVNLNRRTQ